MNEPSFETINWKFDEGRNIGRIELDRPDSLNAVTIQLVEEVVAGFEAFEHRNENAEGIPVRAVVVEGRGDHAFCVGMDIEEAADRTVPFFKPIEVYTSPETFSGPVIAKIDGYCLGGGLELALSCDFRLASKRSTLGFSEIDIGTIPGGGGTQRLARLVGSSRAKELVMTGKHITATSAAADGIVDYVHPADALDERVGELARTLSAKPPLAVQSAKDVIDMAAQVGFHEGHMYEHRVATQLRETADYQESIAAFNEDREPDWRSQ